MFLIKKIHPPAVNELQDKLNKTAVRTEPWFTVYFITVSASIQ